MLVWDSCYLKKLGVVFFYITLYSASRVYHISVISVSFGTLPGRESNMPRRDGVRFLCAEFLKIHLLLGLTLKEHL